MAAHSLTRPWDSPGKNTGVGCYFLLQFMKVKSEIEVAQSCPTLSDPMDCSLPGSSIHGIFQARVLEWGAVAFSTKNTMPGFRSGLGHLLNMQSKFLKTYLGFLICKMGWIVKKRSSQRVLVRLREYVYSLAEKAFVDDLFILHF